MKPAPVPAKLTQLARLYGVQTSYQDMRQRKQEAPAESLLAVVRALGADVSDLNDVDRALVDRQTELWERAVEPVIVAWDGKIPPIAIRALEEDSGATVAHTFVLSSGEHRNGETALAKLPIRNHARVGGKRYVERVLTIKGRFPTGYHRLRVQLGRRTSESLLISAPKQAYFPFNGRDWGIFAPTYSLRSQRNPNAGDLTDFETLIDWMDLHGGRVAATLPLLPAFLDKPFEPGPYSPISRLFWNEFYIDVEQYQNPRKSKLVDYRREMAFRRSVLEKDAALFFQDSGSGSRDRYETFCRNETDLSLYATFRAVTDRQQAGWTKWPQRLRAGEFRSGDYDPEVLNYHTYAQWRIQEQLADLAKKTSRNRQFLYLDLPVGLHSDSYDNWRHQHLFVSAANGGAPPDPVFTQGQNWGFPPMHPEALRLDHHAYTIAYIRNHLRYARLLRIDHVMGLHRLFWIPKGFTGDKGLYVTYPADEMYAILSVESHLNKAGIVGENLGMVPREVNASMKRHNIQQMYVMQYALICDDPKRALRSIPSNSVASLNTHDMPPFRAFLEGTDIDDRLDLGFLDKSDALQERRQRAAMRKSLLNFLRRKRLLNGKREKPEHIFKATLGLLASSVAKVVLINLEDLWGETLPHNVPATQKERPNWRRRARLSLEEIRQSEDAAETLQLVEKRRRRGLQGGTKR